MTTLVDPIGCESRAIEFGHRARLQDDGTFLVSSESRDNLRWPVRVQAVCILGRWRLRLVCDCESGRARPSCGPFGYVCWHGALVGRRLAREGLAEWRAGSFWLTKSGIRRLAQLDPEAGLPSLMESA